MGNKRKKDVSEKNWEEGFAKGPSEFFAQILSCIANDSAPCVIISTDKERFMINAPGGVQRMCTEHRVRMTSLTSILLSEVNCNTLSGLPGMALSVADGGKAALHIVGPVGTKAFERSARRFMRGNFFAINIDECSSEVLKYQHSISVSAIPISSSPLIGETTAKRANISNTDMENQFLLSCSTTSPRLEVDKSRKTYTQPQIEVSYLFSTPPSRGKFDVNKANELGVPKGKLFGELHNGKSITLPNGSVVDPDMVVGKGKPPQHILVLSCSDLSMLPKLFQHPIVLDLFNLAVRGEDNEQEESFVNLVIHLAPEHVHNHPSYQSFVGRFGVRTRHWYVARSAVVASPPTPLTSAATTPPWLSSPLNVNLSSPYRTSMLNIIRLNYFISELFPSNCVEDSITKSESGLRLVAPTDGCINAGASGACSGGGASGDATAVEQNSTGVLPLFKFHVLPERLANFEDVDEVFSLSPSSSEMEKEVKIWKKSQEVDIGKAILAYKSSISKEGVSVNTIDQLKNASDTSIANTTEQEVVLRHEGIVRNHPDVMFTFLGTGCAIPSKNRNASAIHIQTKGDFRATGSGGGGLLFDCGEGTYGQMRRLWGNTRCDVELLNMKLVWISHPHPDHHLGIVELLAARNKLVQSEAVSTFKPILLVAPKTVLLWVEHYGKYVDSSVVGSYAPVGCVDILPHVGKNSSTENSADASIVNGTVVADTRYLGAKEGEDILQCRTCQDNFVFSLGEKEFYRSKGFDNKPSLCQECRASRKMAVQLGEDLVIVDESHEHQNSSEENHFSALKEALTELGLTSITNVRVDHCREAFGVRIDALDGWSVCYSGDCRPTRAFIELGQGCTVCIHEATFEDSMSEDALSKKHCTLSEAIEVGLEMNAYRVILTHFSQRYPKLPTLPQRASSKVIVALDSLVVSFGQLSWAPASVPVLQCLFPPEDIEIADISPP